MRFYQLSSSGSHARAEWRRERNSSRWRASWEGTGGVQEAKGCPLEEGPSSGCVRETCVKSGAKAKSWGAFVIKVPPGATHWKRDPLLGTGVASHQGAQLGLSQQNMC